MLACPDSTPTFLGLFDPSIAPQLLFYSYLPIIIVSLFFGIFVFYKSNYSSQGRNLLYISMAFSVFLLNELVQWIAVPASLVYYGWTLAPLFQLLVWLFTIKFFYEFVENEVPSIKEKFFIILFSLPIILFLSSRLNIHDFDLINCEGRINSLWYYLYTFQIVSIIAIAFWGIKKYRRIKDRRFKNQTLLLTLGISFFLFIFYASNVFGEIFKTYEVNLVGPIGMVTFLGLLTYLIVQYNVFDIKLLGAQALVVSLGILIGSQFFFIRTNTNRVLNAVTFIFVSVFGWWLVRSVKNEIKKKEELQEMTDELARANEQLRALDRAKSEFISIASHQLRTPPTSVKGFTSLILEGTYGKISKEVRQVLEKIYISNERLIKLVEDLLNISRMESGKFTFRFEKSDIEDMAKNVVDSLGLAAKNKELHLEYKESENKIDPFYFDKDKIHEVVSNLTDNALKYTPKGGVTVSVKDLGSLVRVVISDTGIGIDPSELKYVFEKFQRGKDINKVHTEGLGLGLYVATKIVDAHQGKIWAESEGKGKGSRFIIELKKDFVPPADEAKDPEPVKMIELAKA